MKKFLSFLGRILLAQIFLVAILFQLAIIFNSPSGYENYQIYLGHFGLPGVFAPLMILVQLLFGLSLLLGFKTKLSAYVLAVYAVFIAVFLKLPDPTPGSGLLGFMQYIALAGGYITLALNAPTAWSLDNLRKK